MLTLFLALIINTYNAIRIKRQLASEASANILVRNYKWQMFLWTNLIMCRMDKRNKEQVLDKNEFSDDEDSDHEITKNG
jgi:hypothetical protein